MFAIIVSFRFVCFLIIVNVQNYCHVVRSLSYFAGVILILHATDCFVLVHHMATCKP